jgi:hypothetical protein
MTAEVVVTQTADGWDVHITKADDVVVRTVGKRITVAVIPDDDTSPETPLAVTLGAPETVTA